MKSSMVISAMKLLLILLISSHVYADTGLGVPVTPAQPANSTPGAPVDDATIMTRVETVITQDSALAGSEITVASQEGVVTLRGTVSSQAQVNAAVNDAKSVPGVKDVKSNLNVNPNVTTNPNNMPAD